MDLSEEFGNKACWVWDNLRSARNNHYQIGEESITDFLILQLHSLKKIGLTVKSFNKYEESKIGADWEIWLIGSDGKWIGLTLQAKVLKLTSDEFRYIDHKNSNGRQIDLLMKRANKIGSIPLYAFYTQWKNGLSGYEHNNCLSPSAFRHFGLSVVPANIIKNHFFKPVVKLKDIISHLIPIQCLFCPFQLASYNLSNGIRKSLESNLSKIPNFNHTLSYWDSPESPPDYVIAMFEGEPDLELKNFNFDDKDLPSKLTVIDATKVEFINPAESNCKFNKF